jgi:hypothetical protein
MFATSESPRGLDEASEVLVKSTAKSPGMEFDLEVSSTFSANKDPACFSYSLPWPVSVPGLWGVALKSYCLPKHRVNLVEDQQFYLLQEGECIAKMTIPKGHYGKVNEIIALVNSQLEGAAITFEGKGIWCPHVWLDSVTGKVCIYKGMATYLTFSEMLCKSLGINPLQNCGEYQRKLTLVHFINFPDLDTVFQPVLLTTNFCNSLHKSVETGKRKETFKKLKYVPVRVDELKDLSFRVTDENGETVSFKNGETKLKLSFHQITEFSEV